MIFSKRTILVSLFALPLWASQAMNYGLGGATSGRVTSVSAERETGFAAIFNPALMSAQERPLFSFGTSVAHSDYAPLTGILQRSPNTGELRTQNYQPPSTTVTLWSAGLSYPFRFPTLFNRSLGIGFTVSGPYTKLRSFSSSEPDDFYSLRYGTSDSQFKATLGGSVELIREHLFFGTGVSFFLSGAGSADANLSSTDPKGRLAIDVGLQSALVSGLYARWEETSAGFVWHQEMDPSFVQQIDARLPVGNTTLHQPAIVRSSLYYEPHALDFDIQHDFTNFKLSAGVAYQFWRFYRPPVLLTETTDAEGKKHVTALPSTSLENTFSPRLSAEVPLLNRVLLLSVGYQFRPSPVKDLSGTSNVLDSDGHLFGLSLEHQLPANEFLSFPLRWGLSGQFHHLEERKVTKLNPATTGGPGYTFSGNTYTYGIYLQAEL